MGKKIDGLVITALTAAGFYLFYMAAFGSILPAALLAFLSCALARAAAVGFRARRGEPGGREARARAASRVREIARMRDDEGEQAIRELLALAYPGEEANFAADLRVGSFGENDLLRLWRRCGGAERIVILTTAVAERGAAELAARLENPRVRLLDGEQMARLIGKYRAFGGAEPQQRASASDLLRRGLARGTARRFAARNIAIGCAMLALYWFSGRLPNLIAGVALLAMGCVGRMRKRAPETLFE